MLPTPVERHRQQDAHNDPTDSCEGNTEDSSESYTLEFKRTRYKDLVWKSS